MAEENVSVYNVDAGIKNGVTTTYNYDVAAREVDFVTQFTKNWDALSDVMNTMRLIRREPGTALKYRVATVELMGYESKYDVSTLGNEEEESDGKNVKPIGRPGEALEKEEETAELELISTNPHVANEESETHIEHIQKRLAEYNPKYATFGRSNVAEGQTIPYSWGTVAEVPFGELTVDKYAKAVSLESINSYGYDAAVQQTDEEFLNELQGLVLSDFYGFLLACGSATSAEETEEEEETAEAKTWQQCLALARGRCLNEFMKMRRTVTDVIGFANIMDLYTYLGDANVTVQTEFGLSYVQNFMGYSTLLLLSDNEIPRGTVIATPANNIVLYYCDPSHSEFNRAGLQYTVDGETPLVGFHTQGNYNTAVSECFAIMGMTMICEFVDGVVMETVSSGTEED